MSDGKVICPGHQNCVLHSCVHIKPHLPIKIRGRGANSNECENVCQNFWLKKCVPVEGEGGEIMAIIKNNNYETPADRNKTDLTLAVTNGAARYLASMGAKAIETEVPICQGWVADLAAIWQPTRTEAKNYHLIPFKYMSCGSVPPPEVAKPPHIGLPEAEYMAQLADYIAKKHEWSKLYADDFEKAFVNLPPVITILHEVKTSRADFKRDFKWREKPRADMQILSYVKGILSKEELPEGWWALEHDPFDKTDMWPRLVKRCWPLNTITDTQRMWHAVAVANRRHNRTAYAFWRDLGKRHRLDAAQIKAKEAQDAGK